MAGFTKADIFNELDEVNDISSAGIALPAVKSVVFDVKAICSTTVGASPFILPDTRDLAQRGIPLGKPYKVDCVLNCVSIHASRMFVRHRASRSLLVLV